MNKQNRAELETAKVALEDLADEKLLEDMADEAIQEKLDTASAIISDIGNQEREKFDNMPESLQNGERGQAMSDAADVLEGISMPEKWDRTTEDWASTLAGEVQTIIDELDNLL